MGAEYGMITCLVKINPTTEYINLLLYVAWKMLLSFSMSSEQHNMFYLASVIMLPLCNKLRLYVLNVAYIKKHECE